MEKRRLLVCSLLLSALGNFAGTVPVRASDPSQSGRAVYEYYCYQCHGYSGDGRTETAGFVAPPPRDFTVASRDVLTAERMVRSVTQGRPGTAMVAFSSVLSEAQIVAVVDYVRDAFMTETPRRGRYHSTVNGWQRDKTASDAAPFVLGHVSLDTPWESLSKEQHQGRMLFMAACIACHRGHATAGGEVFGLRAVSYPRGRFDHRAQATDAVSGASAYLVHDTPPVVPDGDRAALDGQALYVANCAFCHAPDGSSRNWIGSFLEPRPRDLRATGPLRTMSRETLRQRIANGVPHTAMPAWKSVLSEREIDAIADFIERAFGAGTDTGVIPDDLPEVTQHVDDT